MTRYGVPVHVSTYHWVTVDADNASAAADLARDTPPEHVRRHMPIGTTRIVGTPVPEPEGATT